MRPVTRMGAAIVLASTLAVGLAITPSAAASTGEDSAVRIEVLCAKLAEAIDFLNTRPPSRLRDFLLEQALRLRGTYCQ